MKYVQINTVPNGSTGGIMMKKHRELLEAGEDSYVFWGRGRNPENERECKFGSQLGVYADAAMTRLDGKAGFHSKAATKELLRRLDELNPDVVHLHNIHGYYVNIEMLFDWLKNHDCQVVWTLHDCWAFTGHCAHFTYVGCDQWKTGCASCEKCPQIGAYPATASQASVAWNYGRKRELFASLPVERMKLVVPSRWLGELVGKSFLRAYPVEVIHNTIDKAVFRPTPSDFKERNGVSDKFLVLGVANPWTERKGLGEFLALRALLPEEIAIALVGLSDAQRKQMPAGVIALGKTDSPAELAAIYTAADVFFNPTREDNYPTVNLEAEACGTDVVTYDVGGCRETISRSGSLAVPGFEGACAAIRDRALSALPVEPTKVAR